MLQLVFFYLLLLVMQGVLAVLVAPFAPPDLFLLAALSLLWRLPAWQLIAVGYAVGLVQDVIGDGTLGLHAISLAGGLLLATFVRTQLSETGIYDRVLTAFAALFGKWLLIAFIVLWLGGRPATWSQFFTNSLVESGLTLLIGIFLLPFVDNLLDRASVLRKGLL